MKDLLLIFCLLSALVSTSQSGDTSSLVADNNGTSRKPSSSSRAAVSNEFKAVTDDQLLKTSQTASVEMKVTIAGELVERKSQKITELFKKYVASDDVVHLKMGIITYDSNPASELYAAVAHQKEKAERKKYYERTTTKGLQKELKGMFGRDYDTKWTKAETDACLAKLTAIALADNNTAPRTLNTIFYTNNFREKNYARVKFFAQKYPTAEILATLANFKNQADVQMLTQNPLASYLAYSIYPHAAFFPTLQMNVDKDFENPDFQNAVTAYKNPESKIMLEKILGNIQKNNPIKANCDDKLFAFYSVIEKRNCRLYDSVLKKIDVLLQ